MANPPGQRTRKRPFTLKVLGHQVTIYAAGKRGQYATKKAARLRRVVGARDGWLCWWCDRPLIEGGEGNSRATLEHLTPLSRGGDWTLPNLRLACPPCNGEKGSMNESEYLKHKEQAA